MLPVGEKDRGRWRRVLLVAVIVAACAGCDQATKAAARALLEPAPPLHYLHGILLLEYARNAGGLLSLGAHFSEPVRLLVFSVGVAVFLAALAAYLVLSNRLTTTRTVALALFLGGGVSNLLDRLIHAGMVVDFLNLGIGDVRTGIFNLADVAITAGAALYVLSTILPRRSRSSSDRGT